MSWPSKRITPAVGSSNRRSIFAVVVLPQPDSPTRLKVSPGGTTKEMPSTDLTQLRAGRKGSRPRIGKYFLRSDTWSRPLLGSVTHTSNSSRYGHRLTAFPAEIPAGTGPGHGDSEARRNTPRGGCRWKGAVPRSHITA